MRLPVLAAFAGLATAEIVGKVRVDYDKKLEGRTAIRKEAVEAVGELFIKAQFSNPKDKIEAGAPEVGGSLDARSLVSPHLNALPMGKRQFTCGPGNGYCEDLGGCCPLTNGCCPWGYCLEPGDTCCPSGPCPPDWLCCERNNCYPTGGECCIGGTYCGPGNKCFIFPSENNAKRCCTDRYCTAAVLEDGSTSYASTTTSTTSYTVTSTQYYYWTVTWWYWYYFWSYSARIEGSVVTSTRSTTSTTLSVATTDADAASDYFGSLSSELELPTPSAAVSLESLAGSTSYGEPADETALETEPLPTSSDSSDDDDGFDIPTIDLPTLTGIDLPTLGLGDDTSDVDGGGGGGGAEGAASSLMSGGVNRWAVAMLAAAVGTGALAAFL